MSDTAYEAAERLVDERLVNEWSIDEAAVKRLDQWLTYRGFSRT